MLFSKQHYLVRCSTRWLRVLLGIAVSSLGCHDSTSSLDVYYQNSVSAKINGQLINFGDIKAGSEMMGMWIRESAGKYSLGIFPGGGGVDTLGWYSTDFMFQSSPSASLNNYKAVKDVGELAIIEHDWHYQNIRGTFDFAIVDSTLDTIRITEGNFKVHYIGYD